MSPEQIAGKLRSMNRQGKSHASAVGTLVERASGYLILVRSVNNQETLDAIAFELNIRPRKRSDFACPIERMSEVLQKSLSMQHKAPASIQYPCCTDILKLLL